MPYIELTNDTREAAWSVSMWFIREYLYNKDISLTIDERDLSGEGVSGWCIRESERCFQIQIHSGLMYDYIPTLLHELEHVRQHVFGEPRDEYKTHCKESELLDKYRNRE